METVGRVKSCEECHAGLAMAYRRLFEQSGSEALKDLEEINAAVRDVQEWQSHFQRCHACFDDRMRQLFADADASTRQGLISALLYAKKMGLQRERIKELWQRITESSR